MRFSLIFTLFITLIFSESKAQPSSRIFPLVKIIRDESSPDSNTVIVTYDSAMRVIQLEEYIKLANTGWKAVESMAYKRDKSGKLLKVSWYGDDNFSKKNILRKDTDDFLFSYDENGRLAGGKLSSLKHIHQRYDYNHDGLIIRGFLKIVHWFSVGMEIKKGIRFAEKEVN